eukprot:3035664-Alexandrium_andersonii.AAC.1
MGTDLSPYGPWDLDWIPPRAKRVWLHPPPPHKEHKEAPAGLKRSKAIMDFDSDLNAADPPEDSLTDDA